MTDTYDVGPIIDSIAAEYARKFGRWGVERDDLTQELDLWVWKHPQKLEEWFEEDHGVKMLARTLRNEASRHAQEWKASYLGYSYSDLTWYAKGEIRALLPAMFDQEAWLEPPVSDEGGRSQKAPSEGGNWVATMADLAKAFEALPVYDRNLLYGFHADGLSNKLMAELLGVSEQAASKQHDRAVSRLHRLLGGDRPRTTHDAGRDGCECEYVGTRRAMSNAGARAKTEGQYDED